MLQEPCSLQTLSARKPFLFPSPLSIAGSQVSPVLFHPKSWLSWKLKLRWVWFLLLADDSRVTRLHYRTLNLDVEGSQGRTSAGEGLSLPSPAAGQRGSVRPGLQTGGVRWVLRGWWNFGSSWTPEELCLLLLALSSALRKVFVKRYFAGQANVNELVTSLACPWILVLVDYYRLCSAGRCDVDSGQWFVLCWGWKGCVDSGVNHSSRAQQGTAEPGASDFPRA